MKTKYYFLILTGLFFLLAGNTFLYAQFDDYSVVGEIDFKQNDTSSWETITYKGGKTFSHPILVIGIPTHYDDDPVTIRVRNVGSTSFECQLDEWNYQDGEHDKERMNYLVYEEGRRTNSFGAKIEADKVTVTDEWQRVEILQTFNTPPIVLAQCVTRNGSDAVTTRIQNVTTSSFEIRLQEEEGSADGGTHFPEDVHYILVAQHENAFLVNGVTDTWKSVDFEQGGAYITSYRFGAMQTANGTDPCVLRFAQDTYGEYEIMLQEETSYDTETTHSFGEKVGIFQFSTPNERSKPDKLDVKIDFRSNTPTGPYDGKITFINQAGDDIPLSIHFDAPDYTTGNIIAADLPAFQEMYFPNNRSYWDIMWFENESSNNISLDISKLEVTVEYNRPTTWDNRVKIALATNVNLSAGGSTRLNLDEARIEYALDYLNYKISLTNPPPMPFLTRDDYDTMATPIKMAITDLGKCGSSDSTDSKAVNPKYGLDIMTGPYYCGEFVSWYYYEAGYKLYGDQIYDFLAPGDDPGTMANWFNEAGLWYQYDVSDKKFYYVDSDNNPDKERTAIPKPGDYFGRKNSGHAMMLLLWDESRQIAYVIDGPYPATIRTVNLPSEVIIDERKFFIGRIPDNDEKVLGKVTFTQQGPNDWKSVSYGKFFYDPIVIMGIPSYNENQPATMRVKEVDHGGFRFQLDEWDYLDGEHAQETVDYFVYEKGCHTSFGKNIEAGKVSVGSNWVTVNINHNYTAPPVVLVQCVSVNEDEAVTTRIRNVKTTSFEVRLQEEEGSSDSGFHVLEEVHYILYEQSDAAFFVDNMTEAWRTLPPPSNLNVDNYGIFGSIQTMNGPDPCVLRQITTGLGNYNIKLEEETSYDDEIYHPFTETVGIIRLPIADPVFPNVEIKAYMRDEALHEANITKPRIFITNTGGEAVSDFYYLYRFTVENGKTPVIEDYSTPLASVSLRSEGNGVYSVKYDFTGTTINPGDTLPDSSGNVVGIHYSDWSYFDTSNDFSFAANNSFQWNEKIAVYNMNDELLSGIEP